MEVKGKKKKKPIPKFQLESTQEKDYTKSASTFPSTQRLTELKDKNQTQHIASKQQITSKQMEEEKLYQNPPPKSQYNNHKCNKNPSSDPLKPKTQSNMKQKDN